MTRTTPATNPDLAAVDDLDDLAEEIQTERTKPTEPHWSGRKTRIKLQFPILRGTVDKPAGRFLDGSSDCMDCGQGGGHQFHASASRVDGRWIGPEGDHLRLLEEGGWLRGTRQSRDRADRQRRRDELVGPEASRVNSAADLEHLTKFEMKSGAINPEIESSMRREEAEQLRRAVQSGMADVAEVIRELVAEKSK